MADAAHVVFIGPNGNAGDVERGTEATKALREAAKPILEELGGEALLDALISVWLDLMLSTQGVKRTDDALRLLRRDLPKFAAALRAMKAGPHGKPDA
jgi:hypothetical protein